MTAHFVTAENDFPQLLLSCGLVDKSKLLGPDAVELNTPWSGFNKLFRPVSKSGL